jgi:membrane protein YqaA with SNARE-associated domain
MTDSEKTAATAPAGDKKPPAYPKPRNPLKRLYNWVLHWAETPYGVPALFFISFAESSFFPIPPDVLLIALGLAIPRKSYKFALVCSVGGICGAVLGYIIGYACWGAIGQPILAFYQVAPETMKGVTDTFRYNQFLGVWLSGFTPIPYKVFTIISGAFGQEVSKETGAGMFSGVFWTMMFASACGRPLRFFFVGALMHRFGKPIGAFIHKYFNLITLIFGIGIVGGFLAIKYLHLI